MNIAPDTNATPPTEAVIPPPAIPDTAAAAPPVAIPRGKTGPKPPKASPAPAPEMVTLEFCLCRVPSQPTKKNNLSFLIGPPRFPPYMLMMFFGVLAPR